MAQAINLASIASKGTLPVDGGLLDQANWFFEAWQALEGAQNRIDAERIEKMKR